MPTRRHLLTLLASSTACSASLARFPFDGGPLRAPAHGGDLQLTFFSVACFIVSFRGTAILTDPFFTHVPFGQVGFGKTEPDPEANRLARPYLSDVRAVLIGHGHYDHCLDLVPVAAHLAPDARIVASQTVAHTFAPTDLARPIDVANPHLATPTHAGRWLPHPSGRLRVLPIASGHPDNIPGIHLWRRRLEAPRTEVPTRGAHYQEGLTLAFLVDWLDEGGAVAARVYIQNASTGPPDGLAPPEVLREHPVDAAILGMDTANLLARGKPTCLDHLDARKVLFCHWGDFFRPLDAPPREGAKVNLAKLRATLRARPDGDRFLFPGWHTHHTVSLP